MDIEKEYINCDVCGSNKNRILFNGRDHRFGIEEIFNIVRCDRCGLIYMNPRPTATAALGLYKEVYTPDNKLYIFPTMGNSKLKNILKRIWYQYTGEYHGNLIKSTHAKVLDIGCGNGNLLLTIKQGGAEVYGIEINSVNARYCNEMGLNVFCGLLEEANFNDNFFDTVILSHVIEHLPSPKRTLREIYRILKPGGKLHLFCPNNESYLLKLFGRYWHGWHIPFHFYNFIAKTIENLIKEMDFKIIKVNTITTPPSFTLSLKSYIWGRRIDSKSSERGRFFDSLFFKASISFFLKLLDFVLKGKGDCLEVELLKE